MSDKKNEIIMDMGPCNGCAGCSELNPDIFGWDEDQGRPYLKKTHATKEEIQDALSCCPGDCISLEPGD